MPLCAWAAQSPTSRGCETITSHSRVFEVVAIYLALPVLLAAFILLGKLLFLYGRDWRPNLLAMAGCVASPQPGGDL